jgi:hypothetical protein
MSWLFKKLGYRDREYHGDDFSVRVEQGFREIVTVVHTRQGTVRRLDGERIGKRWNGIRIHLPREVDPADVPQIVRDLETAFGATHYGYVIFRTVRVDPVPEAEQEAAITELNEMGFDVERSTDPRQTVLTPRSGVPRPDTKTAQDRAPRIMALVQSLRGTRQVVELLAKSKEFATDYTDYMPR